MTLQSRPATPTVLNISRAGTAKEDAKSPEGPHKNPTTTATPSSMSNENDPRAPTSFLSKKARLAHWITGGTNRGPSTMSSFVRMTRDRNDIKKATTAWSLANERGLDEHHGQWGRPGLMGTLDQMRGTAPRPRGATLIRWFREGGGANGVETHEVDREDAVRQGQGEAGPVGDDIYGASDDTPVQRAEGGNTGDGGTIAGTATGDGVGQQ